MPNLDSLLDNSISQISDRLTEAQYTFLQNAGITISRFMSMSNEELRQLLYSGGVLDLANHDLARIRRELNAAHKLNIQEMKQLARNVTATVYEEGADIAEAKGESISPKKAYTAAVNPLLASVLRDYEIMSRSSLAHTSDTYKKTINRFVSNVMSDDSEGRMSAPYAIRKAIRELTAEGISYVDYQSGRTMRMDSAVRRDIMNEYGNIAQEISNKVGEEVGFDAVEITVEHAPAEDHADVQGRIFTNEEYEKLQNLEVATDIDGNQVQIGSDRPIGLWNCRHFAMPFMLGVSERNFTPEQLEAINKRNEDGITFNGEKMSVYEGTQRQRQLETSMRRERENLNMLKELRDTDPLIESDYQKSRRRLAGLRDEYKALGAALEPKAIRMKIERSYVTRGSTGGFKAVTGDIKNVYQNYSDRKFSQFSDEQRKEVVDYTKHTFKPINKGLFNNSEITPEIQKSINTLDDVLNNSQVLTNAVVYKGTNADWYTDWHIGDIKPIPSFFSTSINKKIADEFNLLKDNPLLIEVLVPKGTKGLYLGTNSKVKKEVEILLNRNLKYKVLIKTDTYMKLEIVN